MAIAADTALGNWSRYSWLYSGPILARPWLDAIANQASLYSRESVASIPVDETTQKMQLGRLSEILKVDLSQARVALPGLTLKRVELLQFENRPLSQLLYQGEHGVVTLCIMPEPGGESEREAERRANLNTVYWARRAEITAFCSSA